MQVHSKREKKMKTLFKRYVKSLHAATWKLFIVLLASLINACPFSHFNCPHHYEITKTYSTFFNCFV